MAEGAPPTLPSETQKVFTLVSDELSVNLQSFLDSVPAVTKRYTDSLERVKKANPRERIEHRSEVLSPLLTRRESPGAISPPPPTRLDMEEQGQEPAAPTPEPAPVPVSDFAATTPTGPAPDQPPRDQQLLIHTQTLKTSAYELRVVLSGICDWIEMQMPAIKLEDNRGVAVQEQVIRHLVHMRTAVQGVYERDRLYREKLAEYSSKYFKFPEAKSQWADTIEAWNEEHWDQLERDWREVRHIVVLAARLLSLNMDKLAAPREDAGGQSGGVGMAYM